ncbi:MAG: methyltransferase [Sulfurovaceae bacterium]|nr:methyltransferase [Sulfurovaceae bacterium]
MILYQSPNGYCYNSDSIFLIHFISSFALRGRMLDVGCGVGIVGLVLSCKYALSPSVIDKQAYMIEYASHNYAINEIDVEIHNEDFLEFTPPKNYDIIVSNPPFYADGVIKSEDSSLHTARYAIHLPLDSFFAKVHKILSPQGRFFFCYDAKQIGDIFSLLKKYHLTPEVVRFVHSKSEKESKLVLIACRHNSKASTKILPPLIIFEKNDIYTDEAKDAFKFVSAHSIKAQRG